MGRIPRVRMPAKIHGLLRGARKQSDQKYMSRLGAVEASARSAESFIVRAMLQRALNPLHVPVSAEISSTGAGRQS